LNSEDHSLSEELYGHGCFVKQLTGEKL